MTAAAIDIYGRGLATVSAHPVPVQSTTAARWRIRYDDGSAVPMALDRWCARFVPGDRSLVDRCTGPTLDVGCGPGRLAAAVTARGIPALGIDIAPDAVRLARAAGASALQRSVFGRVPGAGRWSVLLLADGNVGIGGDPVALLCRSRELLATGGRVLCEVDPPGTCTRRVRVRLEGESPDGSGGPEVSSWFPWAHLAADDVSGVADGAGLDVAATWQEAGRWFVALARS